MIDWDSCVLWLDSRYFSESYWWDRSKYRNDGVVHGAKWKENGFYFDGNNDYVNCGNGESFGITDAITIEAWIKADNWTNPNNAPIVDKWYDGSSRAYSFWAMPDGELRAEIANADGSDAQLSETTTLFDMATGTWYHVAVAWDKIIGNLKFYKNGKLLETLGSGGTSTMNTNNQPLQIGTDYNGDDNFKGIIAEVRIYNRALSEEEIKILYNLTYRR